jgi:hypothetical protein
VKQVSSELTSGGNINLESGGDTNIIASNLTAAGSGNLTAGKTTDSSGNIVFNQNASLNILGALNSDYEMHYSLKLKKDFGAIVVGTLSGAVAGAVTGGPAGAAVGAGMGANQGASAKKGRISLTEKYDEKVVASNLNFGGSAILQSANDMNLTSANVTSTAGTTLLAGKIIDSSTGATLYQNANNSSKLNIASLAETHYSKSETKKIKPDYLRTRLNSLTPKSSNTNLLLLINNRLAYEQKVIPERPYARAV